METMWVHVRAPFAAFRWFQAGVYRATHPIMPPSSAYGLLLNLAAIDMRDAVAGPITLIRSDTPLLRIAIGIVTPAERCSLYQQLHTYPVGNAKSVHRRFIHSCGDLGLCLSRQALDSSRDFWSLIYLG
jgi:CRISPR-associated protein Cas5t